jgi:hypothetical protein
MTTELRWPCERFFWAVIDAPGVKPKGGDVPVGLLTQLQEEVPVALEEVHAVSTAVPEGKLIVCAARREDLRGLPEGCLSLAPDDVPQLIEPKIDAAAINLLVGDFEPLALRRELSRRRTMMILTAAAATCLAAVGLVKRADGWTRAGQQARTAISALAASPVALRADLERLRKAPRVDTKALTPPDASVAMASLLSAWPKELECQTESVNIGPSTMTLAVTVSKDARPFLSALKPPEGWTIDEPRLTATADGSRLHLALHRKEARP